MRKNVRIPPYIKNTKRMYQTSVSIGGCAKNKKKACPPRFITLHYGGIQYPQASPCPEGQQPPTSSTAQYIYGDCQYPTYVDEAA